MLFWAKKAVSLWLMPLPLCLVLLVAGLWLTRAFKRSHLGRALLVLATGLLLFLGNKAVSMWLVRPLETAFAPVPEFVAGESPPPQLASIHFVVVLGGGHADARGFSAVNKLSASSRGRLMEGLRILHALPDAKLVVSGRGIAGFPSHAAVQAAAAISLGVDPTRIIKLETPRDTDDETAEIGRIVGRERFALVTSAWHMRRAVALMQRAGLEPVPCPADFLVRPSAASSWTDYMWDTDSLGRSTWAIYERLGYAWSWLQGKI